MPIEKKSGLFYELMIRGNWNPEAGELGAIMTYQLQTGTALVDTDSNSLVAPYAPDPAVDLTREQAVAFLGEQMAGFLDHLSTERAQSADLQKRLDAATSAGEEAAAAIAQLTRDRAGLEARLKAVLAAVQD